MINKAHVMIMDKTIPVVLQRPQLNNVNNENDNFETDEDESEDESERVSQSISRVSQSVSQSVRQSSESSCYSWSAHSVLDEARLFKNRWNRGFVEK
jgi:hypothetical protein